MSDAVSKAIQELSERYSPEEALSVLDALDSKRRREKYICYWEPYKGQEGIFNGEHAFTSKIKVYVIRGGNRSGKTLTGGVIAVAWALGKDFFRDEPIYKFLQNLPIPEPPNNIWIVGLDYPTVRDVIWREKFNNGKDHPPLIPQIPGIVDKKSESDFQIFFSNGSIITCKSADSGREKFQGASVDLVWIDEEPEEDIYDECYQRTVDCGGKILVTLTPLTDIASGVRTPWVFDLFEAKKSGKDDVEFFSLSVLDNPYVPDEEKEKLRDKWAGHHEERARLYGEFIQRQGLVYNLWNRGKHVVRPFRIPSHWRRIVSIDPAATGITGVLWGAVDGYGNIVLYREYYKDGLVISEHVRNILVRNSGEPIDIWLIDPKFGTQKNAETHRSNLQIFRDAGLTQARLAPIDEDFGLNASREYLAATTEPTSRHPKLTVFEDLHNFISEIEHYTWDVYSKGPLKGLSKERPKKRNDHLMNAMQYMCSMKPKGVFRATERTREEKVRDAQVNSYF